MARALSVTALWAAAILITVVLLAGCTRDRTDWAGISQAIKERRP